MRLRMMILLTALLLLCSGCGRTSQKPMTSVVARITVASARDTGVSLRQFTDDESMSQILNYLRLAKLQGTAPLEDAANADIVHSIRLEFADGRTVTYEQADTSCLRRRDDPWKRLDPEYGEALIPLLRSLPARQTAGT